MNNNNRGSDRRPLYSNPSNTRGQLIPLQELPVKDHGTGNVPYGSPSFNDNSRQNRYYGEGDGMEKENLLTSPVQPRPTKETTKPAKKDAVIFKQKSLADEFGEVIPKDRYKLVYLIIMLHGIGTLMPWNMFITANKYFSDYKLGNETAGQEAAQYREDFLAYLGISTQLPNVICNGLNLFIQFGGSFTVRIVSSLFIEAVLFIFTIVLAMLDTSSWPGTFFWLTMATVVLLSMSNGVYQNTVYGIAGKLPMKYTNAVVLGSNISGTLVSIISIITLAISPNIRTAVIYYFLAVLFVLLACFDTYFALPLIKFYRYYQTKACKLDESAWARPPFLSIFKKIWVQCLNVFMVFFVTLSIFPNIHTGISQVDKDFFISPKYFTPITCFLTFNTFAMIGNIFPNWIRWPGPRFLIVPVLLRLAFIPLFMFCNYDKRSDMIPVFITNDWAYLFISILLGITSGYYSSLAMMYAPSCVEPKHAGTAAMMAAFFLVFGIFAGINFSLFLGHFLRGTFFSKS